MPIQCDHCGKVIAAQDGDAVLCPACGAASRPDSPEDSTAIGHEFDRRGIRLPARSPGGGIIVPQ